MEQLMSILIVIAITLAIVFIIRWIGAWMLRIDEVIDLQKSILKELQNQSKVPNNKNRCDHCGTFVKDSEKKCSKCGITL